MGLFDDIGGLGYGMLGLGAASDIFGAYSQQQAAQRQRDQMNRQYALAQQVTNPQFMAGQAQKLVQGYSPAEQQYFNQIFNANLAGRGLQEGQAGNEIVAQAWAPLVQQQYTDALNRAYGAYGTASGATGSAPLGSPAGGSGGTMGALQQLALLQAMQRGQQPNLSPGQTTFGQNLNTTPGLNVNPSLYAQAQGMPYSGAGDMAFRGFGSQLDSGLNYFGGTGG